MRVLKDIEPRDVWYWFEEICGIPRPSGGEARMADFLVEFAGRRGLGCRRDDANNVLIVKDGRGEA
ncbi:MAG: hypothetical protein JXR55_06710, partial [Candidatus Fermentibacteraceae bacterium]|nr:hypothetical protein [Candidatus Fermentibacteraceae bacterium]